MSRLLEHTKEVGRREFSWRLRVSCDPNTQQQSVLFGENHYRGDLEISVCFQKIWSHDAFLENTRNAAKWSSNRAEEERIVFPRAKTFDRPETRSEFSSSAPFSTISCSFPLLIGAAKATRAAGFTAGISSVHRYVPTQWNSNQNHCFSNARITAILLHIYTPFNRLKVRSFVFYVSQLKFKIISFLLLYRRLI